MRTDRDRAGVQASPDTVDGIDGGVEGANVALSSSGVRGVKGRDITRTVARRRPMRGGRMSVGGGRSGAEAL